MKMGLEIGKGACQNMVILRIISDYSKLIILERNIYNKNNIFKQTSYRDLETKS